MKFGDFASITNHVHFKVLLSLTLEITHNIKLAHKFKLFSAVNGTSYSVYHSIKNKNVNLLVALGKKSGY